jgi:hypothetical protein
LIRLISDLITLLSGEIGKCNERLPFDDQRNGGYLCVFHNFNKPQEEIVPLAIVRIGIPTQGKEQKYFDLCLEKARRLISHPEHLSSWQSRDIEKERYGGAIRTPNFILAFSGLKEEADEAILVNGAVKLEMLAGSTAGAIASFSQNELISV